MIEYHQNYTLYSIEIIDYQLFYSIIIIFTILIFTMCFIFSLHFCNLWKNNPIKRYKRTQKFTIKIGELEHILDKDELNKLKELENQSNT